MTDHGLPDGEEDVKRLVGAAPPVRPMPEADRRRVLAALRARAERTAAVSTPPAHAPQRRFAALAAAAAVVVAVILTLWPGGGGGGIVWADVARQLKLVRTMGGPLVKTLVGPDGTTRVITGRMYFKDPGLSRHDRDLETVTMPDGSTKTTTPPNSVLIVRAYAEDLVVVQLFPERHEAIRSQVDVTGSLLGPWRELELNPVFFAWSKLHELSTGSTRVIGRREVAGVEAIGFAAPLAEVLGPQQFGLTPDGEIRVWASAETAVPLVVEIDKRLGDGTSVTDAIEPIEWNAPMPDSLFDDSVLEGYTLHERRAHTRGFPEPELKPHVTLRIGPDSGGPVVNELDVVGAVMGTVSFEPWKRPRYRAFITFELTEDGSERLKRYLQENATTPLEVDFNGELHTPWMFREVTARLIQVEITSLRKRLIDFELQYLLHGEETVAAELERRRAMTATPVAGEDGKLPVR